MNLDKDYDIFGMTEFKFLLPTIYAMGINVVRHDDNTFDDQTRIKGYKLDENGFYVPIYEKNSIEYTYNLTEYNFGLKFPINYIPKIFKYPLGKLSVDMYYAYAQSKAKAAYDNFSLEYTYLKDKSFNFKLSLKESSMGLNGSINPTNGRNVALSFSRHSADFFKEFDVDSDYGTLKEVYALNEYNRFELDWREYFSLPLDMGLSIKAKGTYLDKDGIDDFFNDYIGGLTGLRGYSFYSLGGTRTVMGSATWRFPIIQRIDKKIGFFNFKKLYGGVFVEGGKAWREDGDEFQQSSEAEKFKTGLGVNLRLYGISFYGMPTSIDYAVGYGLDEFSLNDGTKYGKSAKHYLTVLFDFMEF